MTATGADLPDTTTAVRIIPASPPKGVAVVPPFPSTHNNVNGSQKEIVSNSTDRARIKRMRAKKQQRKKVRRMKQRRGAIRDR